MNIYIGSIKIFRRTGCFIQCRQPGKRTHSHYKKWQIIPKQRWNIVKISFLILCAEIVEFIFSYCFTGYVNFFDLLVKLNYFVNSFSSLYRNVLYDPVQKKDSLRHGVHNFTAYVSQLKTKDCSNYKYLHVAYKKYLSWKH